MICPSLTFNEYLISILLDYITFFFHIMLAVERYNEQHILDFVDQLGISLDMYTFSLLNKHIWRTFMYQQSASNWTSHDKPALLNLWIIPAFYAILILLFSYFTRRNIHHHFSHCPCITLSRILRSVFIIIRSNNYVLF